ncbi:MAG: TonB-dependent receptor [Bacteroidetes bacterium]|nr:TonB-dependent receptor [Bacteroidota bacterium]
MVESIYGTMAEIGAGQEVASNFFKAGAASGTVAKTMSAYDMAFSDAIYGPCERYVAEERLMSMLDKEYTLLNKRLAFRAKKTNFFAFADTVQTLNYQRSIQGHGWMGLRFQLHPLSEPNDIVIHVVMTDNDPVLQQQALGMVGVNLIYAVYFHNDPEDIVLSLVDNLNHGRVEIDMISLVGPDYRHVDNRLMSLKLVKNGLTQAALFDPNGQVLQPSEALYKKNVIVLRGRFKPVTLVNVDMLITGLRRFKKEEDVDNDQIVVLTELTLADLRNGKGDIDIDENDFLDRVDILCSLGQNVMISNYQRHYKLVNYLGQFTREKKKALIIGINNLERIFDETYYEDLPGGILQSFGDLFGSNIKVYIYPALSITDGQQRVETCETFKPVEHLVPLYQYLKVNGKVEDLTGANIENLHIISDNILEMIQKGRPGWEEMVPSKVSSSIKKNMLFGFKGQLVLDDDD